MVGAPSGWLGSESFWWQRAHSSLVRSMCLAWSMRRCGSRGAYDRGFAGSLWQKLHWLLVFFSSWQLRQTCSFGPAVTRSSWAS